MVDPVDVPRSGRIRSFVALPLPDGQRARLAAYLDQCARTAPGFRWVPAVNLHLTLRFLGNLEPATLEAVRGGLGGVRGEPFTVALGELGTFGSRSAPRVVWLGVQAGLDEMARLAAAIEEPVRAAGVPGEDRPFRAHLTLARAGSRPRRPELPPPPVVAPWRADELVLYQSRPGPTAPAYVPLARYPLG
ncbi:MAG: RNA 2',3'-cyclic phosphodiesterase [Candidatus Dormibacteraeota bacterium]|nr:RNA 2',3'-cyclic phosphodiesterase [Candidatus Dormibacteraeota bacterium]MBO0762686.1 RNA 2',3'-cyclic phosphodiesterase [Candidatus Dormibacteraeota bacterium]